MCIVANFRFPTFDMALQWVFVESNLMLQVPWLLGEFIICVSSKLRKTVLQLDTKTAYFRLFSNSHSKVHLIANGKKGHPGSCSVLEPFV